MELNIPAIVGIGGSLIYFVDRYGDRSIYDVDFKPVEPAAARARRAAATSTTSRTTCTAATWTSGPASTRTLFNFREIRYFDIEGKKTGLFSRALTSPCGKIRIPINESQDDKSQIEEYLREYRGEGIQHIALSTDDIYRTVDVLRGRGVAFQDTPETYYEGIAGRVAGHQREHRGAAQPPHSHRRQRRRPTKACCCRSSPPTSSARSSSKSSSARETRVSAKAISRHCSSPSNWIRFAGVSFESRALQLLAQLRVISRTHRAQSQVVAVRHPRREPHEAMAASSGRRRLSRCESAEPRAHAGARRPALHAVAGHHRVSRRDFSRSPPDSARSGRSRARAHACRRSSPATSSRCRTPAPRSTSRRSCISTRPRSPRGCANGSCAGSTRSTRTWSAIT